MRSSELRSRRLDLCWSGLQTESYEVALPNWRMHSRERVDQASRLHPLIPRESKRSRKLYRSRGAVEREFGRLKHEWSLLPLRVRGLDRVRLHADLTILTKLACALSRERTRT